MEDQHTEWALEKGKMGKDNMIKWIVGLKNGRTGEEEEKEEQRRVKNLFMRWIEKGRAYAPLFICLFFISYL